MVRGVYYRRPGLDAAVAATVEGWIAYCSTFLADRAIRKPRRQRDLTAKSRRQAQRQEDSLPEAPVIGFLAFSPSSVRSHLAFHL